MATKPKGKAKSAVSGRYVSKQAAAADPERTYVSKTANPKHLVLSLGGLRILRCVMDDACGGECDQPSHLRVQREIDRAIKAHASDPSRKAKK